MSDIAHFGVKGMHWGQRKAETTAVTPTKATASEQERINEFGRGGQRRIGKSLKKGRTVEKAIVREDTVEAIHAGIGIAVGVGLIALSHLDTTGIVSNISSRAEAARGAASMAKLASTASKVPYSKLSKGAFKITTL